MGHGQAQHKGKDNVIIGAPCEFAVLMFCDNHGADLLHQVLLHPSEEHRHGMFQRTTVVLQMVGKREEKIQ